MRNNAKKSTNHKKCNTKCYSSLILEFHIKKKISSFAFLFICYISIISIILDLMFPKFNGNYIKN